MRFGVEQMVVEGRRPGGVLPYGYTSDSELIPEEATLIREVRELYMSGMGYKTIAMKMNREGKLRRGQEWTSATVSYTIENPFYAGIIRLGSKTPEGNYVNSKRSERVKCVYGDGSHPVIFTREEYEDTKKFMNRKTSGGYSRIKTYWFSGVLRCGRCGAAMFGKLSTKRSTTKGVVRTQHYVCSNKHHGGKCDIPVFRQVHVEHLVMEYINKVQEDIEKLKSESIEMIADEGKKTNEMDKAKRDLAKVTERREKWQYMFVEGLIDKAGIRQKMAEEDIAEQDARQRIANNQKSLSGIPRVTELAGLAEAWTYLDDVEKKDYIYTIFNRIEINTDLTNPKGVKNKFFDAYIQEVSFN
ncbi:Recombinase [compost metagenome]